MSTDGADGGLSLALSPLLPPLRFLVRAGATAALRDFGPLW